MSEIHDGSVVPDPAVPATDEADLTGRDRLARNVLWSWAGHFVFVAAGFIMPRIIDDHLGKASLGVWDFAWSLTAYFGLVQMGIGSSVNRYVARQRALRDSLGLNRTVNSALLLLCAAALMVVVLTSVAGWYVPSLFGGRLGQYVDVARWLVILLGLTLAVQIVSSTFVGVITGCHRWDVHNFVQAGFQALTVVAMLVVLLSGGGLVSLAVVVLLVTTLTASGRFLAARYVCPQMRISPRYAHLESALALVGFGGKTFLNNIARMLFYQSSSLLVIAYLDPAFLAVYARAGGLVRHSRTFINKFAFVFTPTASSIHAEGQLRELQSLAIKSARYAAYIALPVVLFLSIFGNEVLTLWMGPDYRAGSVLAVLALGHLLPMTQQPTWSILMGMNAHGTPAVVNLVSAVFSIVLGVLVVGVLKMGLMGAAVALTVPILLSSGIYLPLFACRRLQLSPLRYAVLVWKGPLACAAVYLACILASRVLLAGRPLTSMLSAFASGAAVLGVLYWRFVLPATARCAAVQCVWTLGGLRRACVR